MFDHDFSASEQTEFNGLRRHNFQPSLQQSRAIAEIKDWFCHRRREQQVFRLFGAAGTGKTTITRHAIAELGLDMTGGDGGSALYAAFTGKAALVMNRMGTPASTIHKLIYRVWEPSSEATAEVRAQISELRAGLDRMGPAERTAAEAVIRSLEKILAADKAPRFALNRYSQLRDADLLVLDEVSMVGTRMADDLLSFGKPILVLGDPGQLPPIRGGGAFTQAKPDVLLTEIHRQAAESAVVRLATLAREGKPIPFGIHDPLVRKLPRRAIAPEQMLRAGQVICGRNDTRRALNSAMKAAAGFPQVYPEGRGEKIICLKNQHDLGLINGMFLELADVSDEDAITFSATARTEDGMALPDRHGFYKGAFDDHVAFDPDRNLRDWEAKAELIESDWGYAITCHKAQGSQWRDIIVVDDGLGRTAEDRARWLYTAITRAERGLVILA